MLWYSLVMTGRGTSNVYHNICFHGKIRNIPVLLDGKFVCVEALRPSHPNRVTSSVVSLPNHTGQAESS